MAATLIAGMMQHKRAGDQSEATSLKDLEDPMPDMSEHIHAGVLHKCPFYAGPGTTIASWRQVSLESGQPELAYRSGVTDALFVAPQPCCRCFAR